MNRLLLWLALLFSVSVNLAGFGVYIYRSRSNEKITDGVMGGAFAKPLHLSPEQARDYERLHRQFYETQRSRRSRMADLRENLIAALLSPTPDKRMESILQEMDREQALLQHDLIDRISKEKAMLRPDQLPAFYQLLRRRLSNDRRIDKRSAQR